MTGYIDFGAIEKTHKKLNINNLKSDMLIKTDLEGRIDNFKDFKSEALTPVFEAIVNSIQAIEDRQSTDKGKITVRIIREKHHQEKLPNVDKKGEELRELPKIISFEVEDNGIGFDDPNYYSFGISDSTYKKKRGGKGIGRFSWLKAFDKVVVNSIYSENGVKKVRDFQFTKDKLVVPIKNDIVPDDKPQKTTIRLIGFKEAYRTSPSAYKTTKKIAQRILEHYLPYYIGGQEPSIIIRDENEDEPISLDKLYKENIESNITQEKIDLGGEQFTIHHVKLYDTYNDMHKIVFCADNRDVKSYKRELKQILGNPALLDGGRRFYYAAYVSSSFLDACVDSGRTSFNIPEDIDDSESLGGDNVSLNKIRDKVIEQTKIYLSKYIEDLKDQKRNIFSEFVIKNPMLKHVPNYCPNILDEIEVDSPPDKINEVLYKNKGNAEYEIQRNVQELINKTQANSFEEIQDRYNELTQKIDDFNTDNLAGYLIWRKLIIQLLDNKIKLNKQGKYEKEAIIHDIVFPRKTVSDQITFENLNLWIIDEQLTFHQFAASDKELHLFSSSKRALRPDIFICTESDENQNARSVSIIEFKKPQREHFEQDPVSEMYKVIREIKGKQVNTSAGRPILIDPTTRFYCYAICDINDKIIEYAENNTWVKLKDNLGYYQFNQSLNSYTEILSFDEILSDVKKRHKIFFEKLGIKQPI